MKLFGFSTIFSILGTSTSFILGGWDMLIQALLIFMGLDYLTGVLAAIRKKRLNSEVMYWGGIRKGVVIVVVVIASACDNLLALDPPIMRALAIWFYIAREGISIFENVGKLGVPLPYSIVKVFEQLKNKSQGEYKNGGGGDNDEFGEK